MEQLLSSGEFLEFFVEGGRTRSGKPLVPKGGLLSVIVNAVTSGTSSCCCFVVLSCIVNFPRTWHMIIFPFSGLTLFIWERKGIQWIPAHKKPSCSYPKGFHSAQHISTLEPHCAIQMIVNFYLYDTISPVTALSSSSFYLTVHYPSVHHSSIRGNAMDPQTSPA